VQTRTGDLQVGLAASDGDRLGHENLTEAMIF
jgi:hypothetical protein